MIRELVLVSLTEIEADGVRYACRIGRAGVTAEKREGDLMTPVGRFPLRCCYYRADRLARPVTGLPTIALSPEDGWCDDPADPRYNQHVRLPYEARHEKLWRDDHVYDLIIPVGYNDGPIVPGKGSAIFMHLMREDGVGTEGCVALGLVDWQKLLPRLSAQTVLVVATLYPGCA